MPKSKATHYKKESRRSHHHRLVTVTYTENETLGRVYFDREIAEKFAARQNKLPVVWKTRVRHLS